MNTPTEKKCLVEQIAAIWDHLNNDVKHRFDKNESDHVWLKWAVGMLAAMGVATLGGTVVILVTLLLTH